MKKKSFVGITSADLKQVCRIMKLMTFLILFGCQCMIAANTYSQSTRLSLDMKNVTMKELFRAIEKNSEYVFFYNQEVDVTKPVSISVENKALNQILDEAFKTNGYVYIIKDRQVFIKANPATDIKQTVQQQITVTGVVKDNVGDGIIGANVFVKNQQTIGTITDLDGNFTLNVPPGSILVISYTGYTTQEITVQAGRTLEIILEEDSKVVDEVVVTALGIRKEKKALAYSVTEVKGDDLNHTKTTNIATSLVGKVAGVNVVKPSSGVMGSSRITIRGNGSLNGNNQPLYIVDGVPIDNSGYGQAGLWGGNDGGDGISSINSEDIETMSVLKGGTAAALYGSRAANGAIVIATKKGKTGKATFEFNSYFTFDNPIVKNDDFQWEYGQGYMGMAPSEYVSPTETGMLSWGSKLDGSDVLQFDGVMRPYVAQKNNIKNFYNNAWSLSNNLSVSGGTEKAQYRIGVGDMRSNDLYPGSKLERNNVTLNLNAKVTDKLSIQANVMYVRERARNRPNLGDLILNGNTYMWIMPTNIDIRMLKKTVNDDGSEYLPTSTGWISNPYFVAHEREQKDSKDRVIGAIQAQYDFTENWYLRGKAGGDMINRRYEDIVPKGTGYDPQGSINVGSSYNGEFNAEAIFGYKNRFKEQWGVDAFVGWNTMATWWDQVSANGSRFVQPGLGAIGNTETTSGGKSFSKSFINSLFGQAEVSYKSMVYLTFTGRNDWFSALSYAGKTTPNHIFYPSVGLGFIVSEAVTMPGWLPYLKLRGSWAKSGGSVGPYNLGLTYAYDQSFGNNPIGSVNMSTIPNLNLKPLSSISYEAGFDVRFLDNRLGIDFTYYVRNTRDDIVSAGISSASGYDNVLINAGKMNNNGVEVLLTGTPIRTRDFAWNSSFNFSYNKSEVKHITDDISEFILEQSRTGLQGGDGAPGYIYHQVGQPYGIIKGYKYLRNESGDIIYENGLPMRGELAKLGESVHPWAMGFSNDFSFKGFHLNVLVDAKFGGSILSGTNNNVYMYGKHKDTLPGRAEGKMVGKGVKQDGTPNDVEMDPMMYYMGIANSITEEFVYDASFIKLREVSLGYTFPKKITGKIGLADLRLSVVGRNLWTIYDKIPLVDAESSFNNGNAQGLELYGLPATRSWGFNLSVKF